MKKTKVLQLIHSQSSLTKAEHQKIDQISWQPHKQDHIDPMNNFVGSDLSSRIPKSSIKGVLIANSSAFIQNCSPSSSLVLTACHVENWNILGSKNILLRKYRIEKDFIFTHFSLYVPLIQAIPIKPAIA